MEKILLSLAQGTKEFGEYNDCTVRAVSATCGISYKDAHDLCKRAGRKNGRGVRMDDVIGEVIAAGYNVKQMVIKQPNGNRYTPKTIPNYNGHDNFIARVRNHCFAVKKGWVLDWAAGRKHPITSIYVVAGKDEHIEDFKPVVVKRKTYSLTKKERAMAIFHNNITASRKEIIQLFTDQLDMSNAGASTYYYNCKKALSLS